MDARSAVVQHLCRADVHLLCGQHSPVRNGRGQIQYGVPSLQVPNARGYSQINVLYPADYALTDYLLTKKYYLVLVSVRFNTYFSRSDGAVTRSTRSIKTCPEYGTFLRRGKRFKLFSKCIVLQSIL